MTNLTILQIGTDISVYLNIFAYLLIGGLFLLSSYFFYKGVKTKKNWKKNITLSVLFLFLSIMTVVIGYFAMGPGVPTKTTPIEQDGTYKYIMEHPNEKSENSIKLDAINSKPEELKIQDSSFVKEAKEADDYIKKTLEKYK